MNFKKLSLIMFVFILSISLVFALDFNFNSGISSIKLNRGEFDSVRLIVADDSSGPILLADLVSSSPTDSLITLGNENVFLSIGTDELAYNYISSYSEGTVNEVTVIEREDGSQTEITTPVPAYVFNRVDFDDIVEVSDNVYLGNPLIPGYVVSSGNVYLDNGNNLLTEEGKIILNTDEDVYSIGMSAYTTVENDGWRYFSGEISGETLETSNPGMWRAGTEKATVLILANYQQDEGYELFFDNIRLVESNSDVNFVINGNAEGPENPWGNDVSIVSDDVYDGTFGFSVSGWRVLESNIFEVDTSKTYQLSGWFKSGNAQPEPSAFYFGFVPYTADEEPILSQNVIVVPGTNTTLLYNVSSDDKAIILSDCAGWTADNFNDWVAFGAEDDYSDLPNFNISNKIHSVSEIIIEAGGELMEDEVRCIINFTDSVGLSAPAGTKVREHISGATYLYTAASRGGLSNEISDMTTGQITYNGSSSNFNFENDVFVAGYKFSELREVLDIAMQTSYLINIKHTVQNCIDRGGIVVNEDYINGKTYDELLALAGDNQIVWPNPLAKFDGTDFCWFPSDCPSGWSGYKEWSLTNEAYCNGGSSCRIPCITDEHPTYIENDRETCFWYYGHHTHSGGSDQCVRSNARWCFAYYKQRGCY